MEWGVVVAALPGVAALIGVIVGYRKGVAERGKIEADHDEVVTRTALSLIEPLRQRVEDQRLRLDAQARRIGQLESQVVQLRRENAELHEGVRVLCAQISDLGHKPRWRPNGPGEGGVGG